MNKFSSNEVRLYFTTLAMIAEIFDVENRFSKKMSSPWLAKRLL